MRDPRFFLLVAILVINDHWAKAAYPGVVTGKISDFAGLAFFPLFLQGCWELYRPAPSRRVLVVACLATAIVFALVKTWAPATELYRVGLATLQWPFRAALSLAKGAPLPAVGAVSLAADATDLLALPAVLVAVVVSWPRSAGRPLTVE